MSVEAMENAARVCSACKTQLDSGAIGGLCPKCLIEGALRPDAGTHLTEKEETSRFPATPFTGTRLRYFGDYELLEEIARGGMGVVFTARQVNLKRLVALKVINEGALASETMVKRFKAEAEAAALLTHPSIVPIYEIGEFHGQHYFSMGLIEGQNLGEYLKERAISQSEVIELMISIARAVHYAHQRGVLHRDIKPSNILIDKSGAPHLSDFGLAKIAQSDSNLTQTNALLGTPAYMSPEQARGQVDDLTTAVDVYGLGAVLYECLTGQPPFMARTAHETLLLVLEQEPRRPSLISSGVDPDLETICLKCIQKEHFRRYPSAEALADDLDCWRRAEPISARPVTNLERGLRWTKRNPLTAALVGVSLLAVAALSGIAISIPAYQNAERARRNELQQRRRAEQASLQAEHARDLERTAREREEEQHHIAENALTQLRRVQYISVLNLVEQNVLSRDLRTAENLLDECALECRGWEWNFLKHVCAATNESLINGRILSRDIFVSNVNFDPGDRVLSFDDGLRVFDPATGNLLLKRTMIPGPHGRLDVSPDGKRFAWTAYGYHNVFGSIDIADEHSLTEDPTTGIAFCANGTEIATCGFREANLWDSISGRRLDVVDISDYGFTSISCSPDGKFIAVAAGRSEASQFPRDVSSPPLRPSIVRVWKRFGGLLHEFKSHRYAVWRMAFTPNSRRLVSVSGLYETDTPGEIKVWDIESGEEMMNLRGHKSCVFALAISPDGKRMATGGGTIADRNDGIHIWDLADGKMLGLLKGHTKAIYDLAFSASGRYLASASADATIRVWDGTVFPEYPINLSAWLNPSSKMDDEWSSALSELPGGLRRFNGIRFDVCDSVQVRAPPLTPSSAGDIIGVDRLCSKMHFLHAALSSSSFREGEDIGRYTFHYRDGQRRELNLIQGVHLRVSGQSSAGSTTRATLAWSSNTYERPVLHLYQMTWTNPVPEVEIRGIELSTEDTRVHPLLLGVTVE